jgi:hypothetical protein
MTIPKWALSLIAVAAAAVSAVATGATISWQAGAVLAELALEVRHLRDAVTPTVALVNAHETRIGVAESRLAYCCPPSEPRASATASRAVTEAAP